jgi:hypothetical protein
MPDPSARGSGASIGSEDQSDRLLNLLVGVEYDTIQRVVHEADRQDLLELATSGFAALATNQPSGEDVELRFAHGALEPEQQTVIEVAWVVQTVLVENQRPAQRAYLEQVIATGHYPVFAELARVMLEGRDLSVDDHFDLGPACVLDGIGQRFLGADASGSGLTSDR